VYVYNGTRKGREYGFVDRRKNKIEFKKIYAHMSVVTESPKKAGTDKPILLSKLDSFEEYEVKSAALDVYN